MDKFKELEDRIAALEKKHQQHEQQQAYIPFWRQIPDVNSEECCAWEELMKNPNNHGKVFHLVCNCKKCSPKC